MHQQGLSIYIGTLGFQFTYRSRALVKLREDSLTALFRFVASAWFFFALIMIASYTANLAAFLTVETLERPIESVEDLANQNEIFYGAVNGGSTAGFFAKSDNDVYQRLHMFMSGEWRVVNYQDIKTLRRPLCTGVHQSEVMMGGNTEGVEKVEEADGMYAFFMESAAIDYLVERRCKLSQVGGLLDSKGYGIATSRGTPYKEYLDHAILKLMEGGVLHKLKIKWWKQKRGGGACQVRRCEGGDVYFPCHVAGLGWRRWSQPPGSV